MKSIKLCVAFYIITTCVSILNITSQVFGCIDVQQEPDFNLTVEQKNDFLEKISIKQEDSIVWQLRNFNPTYEKHIVVIIPSYNNSTRYKKNLDSIFMQKYENYHIIYIDDNSVDGTGSLVEKYIQDKNQASKVTVIKNKERRYSLANIYTAVHMCDNNDIIATCDGDDFWCSNIVLETLNKIYQSSNTLVTYGRLMHVPGNKVFFYKPTSKDIIEKNNFRNGPWSYSGLRTFYAWLFKKIKKADLLYQNDFIKSHCDGAYFFPLLEMAGFNQQFIPDVFYVANRATGINNYSFNKQFQWQMAQYIRSLEKYQPLTESYILKK